MAKKEKGEIRPEDIKKIAKEENLMLIEDCKFGREGYVSVQCSWPQLIRFAKRIYSKDR